METGKALIAVCDDVDPQSDGSTAPFLHRQSSTQATSPASCIIPYVYYLSIMLKKDIEPARKTSGPVRTKRTRTTDPDKIPRPPNAWILFRSDMLPHLKSKYPNLLQANISKICSGLWRDASPEIHREYELKAEQKKLEHQAMYPNYRYRPLKREEREQMREARKVEKEQAKEAKRRAKGNRTVSGSSSMAPPQEPGASTSSIISQAYTSAILEPYINLTSASYLPHTPSPYISPPTSVRASSNMQKTQSQGTSSNDATSSTPETSSVSAPSPHPGIYVPSPEPQGNPSLYIPALEEVYPRPPLLEPDLFSVGLNMNNSLYFYKPQETSPAEEFPSSALLHDPDSWNADPHNELPHNEFGPIDLGFFGYGFGSSPQRDSGVFSQSQDYSVDSFFRGQPSGSANPFSPLISGFQGNEYPHESSSDWHSEHLLLENTSFFDDYTRTSSYGTNDTLENIPTPYDNISPDTTQSLSQDISFDDALSPPIESSVETYIPPPGAANASSRRVGGDWSRAFSPHRVPS